MNLPLISCIVPTANRPEFIVNAISNFLSQDYSNKELIIIDDGILPCADIIPNVSNINYFYTEPLGTIGVKRNAACKRANGEFIVHWDDDDWYAPDWVTKQVNGLITSDIDIIGLNKVILYSYNLKKRFLYEDNNEQKPWLCGATFAYRKCLWDRYMFANLQIGEDTDFLTNSGGKIAVQDYFTGFYAGLHAKNTSIRHFDNINTISWTS